MTRGKKIWTLAGAGFLILGVLSPLFFCSARSHPGKTLGIVYGNRINGQLDPCG